MKPLSKHAMTELGYIVNAPRPCQYINAGVVHKLTREGLAEIVQLPSPFAAHKGGNTNHLKATPAGVARHRESQ